MKTYIMKKLFKPLAIITMGIAVIIFSSFATPPSKPVTKARATPPKIQAAILLDVSGSMEGLIEQAKAQLWNMVSTMGRVQCDGVAPPIEIALYEYGRPGNGIANGYVKQLSPFTSNLDLLSKKLFGLTTDGGDEYLRTR